MVFSKDGLDHLVTGKTTIHRMMHECKAADPWGAASEPSDLSRTDWIHRDRRPDESIHGSIVGEYTEESLKTTTSRLSSSFLERVESREPVRGRCDDRWGRSNWECRWRRKEGNEIICNEIPVCMRDGKLAWPGGSAVNDSGDVNVECGKTLSTGNEQAVGSEDLDQGKGIIGPDETVFSLESKSNSSHACIGVGAFLVFVVGGHFFGRKKVGNS